MPEVVMGISMLLLFVGAERLFGGPERGFLTITAAVYEIADADADQADKDAVVEILRAVANTIKTDY